MVLRARAMGARCVTVRAVVRGVGKRRRALVVTVMMNISVIMMTIERVKREGRRRGRG